MVVVGCFRFMCPTAPASVNSLIHLATSRPAALCQPSTCSSCHTTTLYSCPSLVSKCGMCVFSRGICVCFICMCVCVFWWVSAFYMHMCVRFVCIYVWCVCVCFVCIYICVCVCVCCMYICVCDACFVYCSCSKLSFLVADELFKVHKLKPNPEWRQRFEKYLKSMPGYYAMVSVHSFLILSVLLSQLCPRLPVTTRSFFLLCDPRPPSSGWLADAPYWHPSLCK